MGFGAHVSRTAPFSTALARLSKQPCAFLLGGITIYAGRSFIRSGTQGTKLCVPFAPIKVVSTL